MERGDVVVKHQTFSQHNPVAAASKLGLLCRSTRL